MPRRYGSGASLQPPDDTPEDEPGGRAMTRQQALEHLWMLHNTVENNHRATIADRLELFEQTTDALLALGVTDEDYPEE